MLERLVEGARFRPDLMTFAAIGLGLVGGEAATPLLIGHLRMAPGRSSRASIAMRGDADAVAQLVATVEGDTAEPMTGVARSYACAALGLIAAGCAAPSCTDFAAHTNYCATVRTSSNPRRGDGILDIL